MALRKDKGCDTPQSSARKDVHKALVHLFVPIVYFEPEERFFPVDLPSAIQYSSLWHVDSQTGAPPTQPDRDVGTINVMNDLPSASGDHYTTVAGFDLVLKDIQGKPPFDQPVPRTDQVYNKYRDGVIPAVLTIYGAVCRAREVPNNHFFKQEGARDKDVDHALKEGLILNYYMYFPGRESQEFESEGDWAGISLLLREEPTQLQYLSDPEQIKKFLPVIACYYHKTTDGAPPAPHFVAGNNGFRRWKSVKRVLHAPLGLETHPLVYVSRGRHNCYYEPAVMNVPFSTPWKWGFEADKIENGAYTPGPADNTLKGGGIEDTPWWLYALFPPFAAMVACATGCEHPVSFDESGVPVGYEEGEDNAKDGGFNGMPSTPGPGSSYPSTPADQATSKQVTLSVQYVDLDDPRIAALWGYPGAWGAATLIRRLLYAGNGPTWGYYQGARRPALASWFLWNLFLNGTYGCGGKAIVTDTP